MAKQNDHFGGEVGVSFGKKLSVEMKVSVWNFLLTFSCPFD
jgi:hypothetical protein